MLACPNKAHFTPISGKSQTVMRKNTTSRKEKIYNSWRFAPTGIFPMLQTLFEALTSAK
jgi:hypothetical protein